MLVNWSPTTSEIGLLTLHASSFLDFQATVRSRRPRLMALVLILKSVICFAPPPPPQADVSKVIEVRDSDEFTKEAVDAKLSAF